MSLNYVTHKLRAQSLAEGDTDGQEAEIGPAASTVPEEEEEDEEIQVGHIWWIQTIAQDFCVWFTLRDVVSAMQSGKIKTLNFKVNKNCI